MIKINITLEGKEIIQKPTRRGYGEGLVELGKRDERVVVLGADLTTSTQASLFKEAFPERFFSIGIAEQNMTGIAGGLSLEGKIPFICTYGVFSTGRAWDQVRTTVCYSNLNVKIGGAHGGISVGPDGATHQALEDIALMRCLPNMKVIVPCDVIETRKATIAIGEIPGPCFVRFGREPTPVITTEETPFKIGEATQVREGRDVTIIACGFMVYQGLRAAEELAKEGISVKVVNLHTIKPIDKEAIRTVAEETGAIVTAEEHQIHGGMGSAVCEEIVKSCPVPLEMVGIQDRFGESGQPEELIEEFNLGVKDIKAAVRRVLERKRA